jgi:hypothetical protein
LETLIATTFFFVDDTQFVATVMLNGGSGLPASPAGPTTSARFAIWTVRIRRMPPRRRGAPEEERAQGHKSAKGKAQPVAMKKGAKFGKKACVINASEATGEMQHAENVVEPMFSSHRDAVKVLKKNEATLSSTVGKIYRRLRHA